MKRKARYSEDDKATALALLAANGGNITRTAEELGIPASTLRKWRDGGVHDSVTNKCEGKKEELHCLFERVARAYLEHALSDGTLKKTSGKDAIIGAATAIDKMRLLRNEPTTINRTEAADGTEDLTKLTDEELAERIRTLRQQAEQARSGE